MRRLCRLSRNVLCCIVSSNAVQLHFLELRPLIMDQRLPRLDNGYPKQQPWPTLKRHLDYASKFYVPRISWKVEHLGKVTRRRGWRRRCKFAPSFPRSHPTPSSMIGTNAVDAQRARHRCTLCADELRMSSNCRSWSLGAWPMGTPHVQQQTMLNTNQNYELKG